MVWTPPAADFEGNEAQQQKKVAPAGPAPTPNGWTPPSSDFTPNPQENDVGAGRMVQTSTPKPQPQGNSYITQLLRNMNMVMGNHIYTPGVAGESERVRAAGMGVASPLTLGLQVAGAAGSTTAANAAKSMQSYTQGLMQTPGAAQNYSLGQMIPQTLAYELGGGAALANKGAAAASKLIGTGNVVKSIAQTVIPGAIHGLGFGTVAGAMSPVQNPDNFLPEYGKQIATSGAQGAALGGTMAGAFGAAGAAPDTAKALWRKALGTENVKLPPQITSGETVSDVMREASKDPDLSQDRTIADIQRRAQGDPAAPDTQKAQDAIRRLTYAAAGEHGVDLSLGDLSGDPQLRLKEQALESKPGSIMNQFRAKQGGQLRSTIMSLGTDADMETHGQKFGFESQPPVEDLRTELSTERNPTLDAAIQKAQQDRAAGLIGSNLTEPEIIAKKISNLEANPSNPRAIQLSLEGQGWQNRQIDSQNHEDINNSITEHLEANPNKPKTVDVNPVIEKIQDLIRQNKKSPAYSSELDSTLNSYLTNLTGGEVKDLSYNNVHHAVSSMERTIADLKESGNRNLVSNIQQVKNLLDLQKEKFANQTLADDPEMLRSIRQASDFHKDNVVPYIDPDHGLTQIINGVDPDKAVRSLFTDSSPDQFSRIFDKLDPKGKAAVRAEMIGRTEDSASRMKNFQDINLPSFARYLENRADQVRTAFGDDHTLSGLANLIRNTPRAGYQSKLENLFNINSAAGLGAKGLGAIGGYAAGGPVGAGVGTALEMGGELASNRMISNHLTNPKVVPSYISTEGPQMGSSLEPGPIRYAADEEPPRSVGAAGRPNPQDIGKPFQSPVANPEFNLQGKAGDKFQNPNQPLAEAQNKYTAAQAETQGARQNLTSAIVAKREGMNQLDAAKAIQAEAWERTGGSKPQTFSGVETGEQFGPYDERGAIVSTHNPYEPSVNEGTTTAEDRAWVRSILNKNNPVKLPLTVYRQPTVPEMQDVSERMQNWINHLQNNGLTGKAQIWLPDNVPPMPLEGSWKAGWKTVPPSFHAGTPAEIIAESEGLQKTKVVLDDFIQRKQNGQALSADQIRGAIPDLIDATHKVSVLTNAISEMRNSPINTRTLTNELAEARDEEAAAFNRIRSLAPNVRQPVPANNPNTQISQTSLNGSYTESGTISNPRNAVQTGTRGPIPTQPMNQMLEPYVAPQSGNGPASFGPNSVGAAHNPLPGGQNNLDAALRRLEALRKGQIPAGEGSAQPATPTSQNVFEAGQNELESARQQRLAAQAAMPKEPVIPNFVPLKVSTQPPMEPTGLMAKLKAFMGIHPDQITPKNPAVTPTPVEDLTSVKEPHYLPTRSIGTAQQQLEQAGQTLANAKANAPKEYNGPWANPVWREEHMPVGPVEISHALPGTGEEPNEPVDYNQLAQQFLDEFPDLKPLQKLNITDLTAEGEKGAVASKTEQDKAAAQAMSEYEGKPVEFYLNVPKPGSPEDVGMARAALRAFDEETNNLKFHHEIELAMNKDYGATPEQIRQMLVEQKRVIAERIKWSQDGKQIVNKGDDDAWDQHMQKMPR